MNEADITILGGGPTGSALALLLARHAPDPARIVLCHSGRASPTSPHAHHDSALPVDSRAASEDTESPPDPRVIALNHGSRLLLERIGAWPEGGAPIRTIHVSQAGRLGRTLIQHNDFQVPELGTVHRYPILQDTLLRAAEASGVTLRSGVAYIQREAANATWIEQSGTRWASRLVVQAEGDPARHAEARVVQRQYNQHAILAVVQASQPAPAVAWERFTRQGPLALLPLAQESTVATPGLYALVWCCHPRQAGILAGLPNDAFSQALNEAFGMRMGRLKVVSPRHIAPLEMRWRRNIVAPRRVVIGNAAQTLHPVAGQGLNLGLRDADQLAATLIPWLHQSDQPVGPWLRRFHQARRPDRYLTASITDFLPRVFATRQPVIEHAAGSALLLLDLIPALQRPLARQLMWGWRA